MFRLTRRIIGGLLAAALLYFAFTFTQVWWASRRDDRAPASAIVVLGAAQWNGKPSPVLKARLDHSVELYHEGVAKTIIVTGGKQDGDKVGEGKAGYDYLRAKGIPDAALKIEVDGADTYEQLSASVAILDKANLGRSVVIVSSPYHAYRSSAIAEEVGLRPHFSPAADESSLSALFRESEATAAGRIISYRRLSNLQ